MSINRETKKSNVERSGLQHPYLLGRENIGSMFEGLFQPTHLLVIFGIALLVFGPKKFS
jgi:hypothetical protein